MRVLHVIQELGVGGAERVLAAIVHGAREAGQDCAVVAAAGPLAAELDIATYDLPLLERRPYRVPAAAFAVDRALRDFSPDLVHGHNPGVCVPVALATVRGRRVPALASVHGVPDADYAAAARLLRLGGLPVVSCGPGVTAGLREAGLDVRDTIVNGVSPPPRPADRDAVAHEWRIDPKRPIVLMVGRLAPVKNPALAVRALSLLSGPSLVFVGDGPLRSELAALALTEGVADRVVFAGLRADARALMAAADVVVLTSHSEGLPLAAVEALAAGTPLVATAVRGVRELLQDGDGCLLVPPGDPAALAAALQRIIGDDELAARLAARGRELARGYTEKAMVERYLGLYRELAST